MKLSAVVIFLIFTSVTGYAQKGKINPNKYRINMPSFWKPGSKAVQVLADKLPEVCEELKDKELCGDDCRPRYTLEFYMSEPTVRDFTANPISIGIDTRSYNIVTSYSFECALLLFDENDKLLSRINLVDRGQTWTITSRAEILNPQSLTAQRQMLMTSNPRQPAGAFVYYPRNFGYSSGSIWSYIRENEEKLYPTRYNMLSVVDDSIKDL